MSGAYRKAFVRPIDLKWHFMKYNYDQDTLIRSDIEELRGESEPADVENGSQKALIVEFTLPSSSYATMALREILKCDTSVASQMQLQQSTAVAASDDVKTTEDNTECTVESKRRKTDTETT